MPEMILSGGRLSCALVRLQNLLQFHLLIRSQNGHDFFDRRFDDFASLCFIDSATLVGSLECFQLGLGFRHDFLDLLFLGGRQIELFQGFFEA